MNPYLILCACGFARRCRTWSGAEAMRAWHVTEGGEGCEHVCQVSWEG